MGRLDQQQRELSSRARTASLNSDHRRDVMTTSLHSTAVVGSPSRSQMRPASETSDVRRLDRRQHIAVPLVAVCAWQHSESASQQKATLVKSAAQLRRLARRGRCVPVQHGSPSSCTTCSICVPASAARPGRSTSPPDITCSICPRSCWTRTAATWNPRNNHLVRRCAQ
jgi:hypothetical protein